MTVEPPASRPSAAPGEPYPSPGPSADEVGMRTPEAAPAGTDVGQAPVDASQPPHRIQHTRTSGLWVAVAAAALILLLLLIFILQNNRQVQVSFFGADGHLPLGVAMLLSAVAGALLLALIGTARIVQLRRVVRRDRGRRAGRTPR